MARRNRAALDAELTLKRCREPGCNKEFKRPCDLTKHEKTHSRPWKCPVESCKHHEYGWPTEKDMDRHYNDKHSSAPPLYECIFKPCLYRSKRESNCKQHMEKAHGWTYTRTFETGSGVDPMEDVDVQPRGIRPHRDWKSLVRAPANTRKVIRLIVNQKEQIACPDSGSEKNIMSETFAHENDLEISRTLRDIRPFELGSGKMVWSTGCVKAAVQLLGKTFSRKICHFYVFASCPVPLILGMSFLAEAEILTKNRHMLETCPFEFSNISSLLWIGSPRNRRKSPCNRMKCTLDGRKLTAVADTGSDLNFMCPKCAEREGFYVDTREECRRCVQFGDGTMAETLGQVYIHNLSLDWRQPITATPESQDTKTDESLAENEQLRSFGTIFDVLEGIPCDVILGRDILYKTDAFNCCSDLSCSRIIDNTQPFELNILIFRRKRKFIETHASPKELHDDERHAEMLRRSMREDEISLLHGDKRDQESAKEQMLIRTWDDQHAACIYCNPV